MLYWAGISAEGASPKLRQVCWLSKQVTLTAPPASIEDVASDLFEFEDKQYIILVEYYSKFIEA